MQLSIEFRVSVIWLQKCGRQLSDAPIDVARVDHTTRGEVEASITPCCSGSRHGMIIRQPGFVGWAAAVEVVHGRAGGVAEPPLRVCSQRARSAVCKRHQRSSVRLPLVCRCMGGWSSCAG